MKNITFKLCKYVALFFCAVIVSCSVDNRYDLSKDIDMTIAVGDSLSLPLGSTDKVMITELIDPESSDILDVDDDGLYVIEKGGSFDAAEFVVDRVDGLYLDAYSEAQYYDMHFEELFDTYDKAVEGIKSTPYLTEELKEKFLEELKSTKVPVSMYEKIDANDVAFSFSKDGLPKELNRIYRVEFVEPVRLHFSVDVTCDADMELFKIADSLVLSASGLNEESFYISIPDYVELIGDDVCDGKLYVDGAVNVNKEETKFSNSWDYYVKALDFKGGLEVIDGVVSLSDTLAVNGAIVSNMLMLEVGSLVDGLRTFNKVAFIPSVEISEFEIKNVVASVKVDIDDINEVVDVELGDGLDFLHAEGTVLDFAAPQLIVNIENNSVLAVNSDVLIRGFDKEGAFIEGSEVALDVDIAASAKNSYFITTDGAVKEGYKSIKANLNSLFSTLPHSISFEMKSENDSETPVDVYLGSTMSVSGDYEVRIPLDFNDLALKYTKRVEDVLGDDQSELADYVKNVDLVTVNVEMLNSIPVELVPTLRAYDADGDWLKNLNVSLIGKVAAGRGVEDGKLAEPVRSAFKIEISATANELSRLNTIELDLEGRDAGKLNINEYIKIEKMSLTVNNPIVLDLN